MSLSARVKFTPRSDLGRFVETRVTPAVTASVEAAVDLIYDRSQELVAVDTGELKASGVKSVNDTGKTVVGRVEYTADHADFVEYGTGAAGAASPGAGPGPYNENWPGMVAQPYLRPAYDESKEPIKELFRDNLMTGLSNGR